MGAFTWGQWLPDSREELIHRPAGDSESKGWKEEGSRGEQDRKKGKREG